MFGWRYHSHVRYLQKNFRQRISPAICRKKGVPTFLSSHKSGRCNRIARGAVSAASMITLYESVYTAQIMADCSTSDVPLLSVLVASFALDVQISEEWPFFSLGLAVFVTLSSIGDNDCFVAQDLVSLARGLDRRYCRYYWYLQM